jgi:hypothetical protein
MDEKELAQLFAYLNGTGNVSELLEIEEVIVDHVPEDADRLSLGGSGAKTVWSEDQKRIVTVRRRKLIFAHDGHLILDPESIAGFCAVCKEKCGRRTILSKTTAKSCVQCGRLLCPDHQVIVGGIVYCPAHGKWPRIKKFFTG